MKNIIILEKVKNQEDLLIIVILDIIVLVEMA